MLYVSTEGRGSVFVSVVGLGIVLGVIQVGTLVLFVWRSKMSKDLVW